MYRKVVFASASVLCVALGAVTVFAETPELTTNRIVRTASSTPDGAGVLAKIQCISAAVQTRETALSAAMSTFTDAQKANYLARSAALVQAYKLTSLKEVQSATKAAWNTFTANEKAARKAWQSARDAAWKAYRTPAVACKAPAGTGDGVHSELEASGN